jgi:hypothetical protein
LRNGLVEIAKGQGFPQETGRKQLSEFDAQASAWLSGNTTLSSGEALRDDVWAFIATALVPDVTYWRFGTSRSRYHGGVRNTFQRLWMRGRVLDRGRV